MLSRWITSEYVLEHLIKKNDNQMCFYIWYSSDFQLQSVWSIPDVLLSKNSFIQPVFMFRDASSNQNVASLSRSAPVDVNFSNRSTIQQWNGCI